ncbi:MAG: NTP transferase domain-containing protein [Candidatus Aenigmarchaeota archaeon]|nr:NTP transferase domain-containing protein [Candidatus Aenigmarchaeota archaeon]
MKTVFLAGGIGKRMFPLMEDKFLFKFVGKTLLEHHIEMAFSNGLDDFIVIGNPENIEKIKSMLHGKRYKIQYAVQTKPNGMANALLAAKDLLVNDEIVIINPNDVFEKSAYPAILAAAKNSGADSYILGQEVNEYFPGGYLVVDEDNFMKGIVEKPGKGNEPSNLVNIVVHCHRKTKELFSYLENTKSANDDLYEASMDRMIKDGFRFKVVRYTGAWKAIKYPWHMLEITKHFLNGLNAPMIDKAAKIATNAIIEGGAIISAGARVMENAVVKGPCYIGRNSVVGNNALVREYAHIGDNSVVGFSTEIKNSYIGDNCWFHTAYVGDCVIADNCSLAAGTIVTNVRLDESDIKVNVFGKGDMSSGLDHLGVIMGENCKTGSNVTLMPGVRVGPNSVVGPGVVLREDLEPNKLVYAKQEQVVKENNVLPNSKKKEEVMRKLVKLEENRKK